MTIAISQDKRNTRFLMRFRCVTDDLRTQHCVSVWPWAVHKRFLVGNAPVFSEKGGERGGPIRES